MVTEGEPHHQSDSSASFLRAARSGNIDKIQEYLQGSIDINASNANGLNALHLAAKEGHIAIVTELVKKGANVNAATKKGNTALHIASLAGQEEVAKILIRNGANANLQSQNGFTPLYMAAQENHDNVVKFLLANGANQSIATADGFTPLAVALQQGHDKVVAVLLENDAKGRVRLPALHIAAKKDDCKAAALLLQNDHDPDVTSKSGFTPLHIAAHYGNEKIGALLLDKNADVNYSAKHQITPLHVAAKWGKSNMVTLLVDKGANIDASTRDGLTPLHCAARSGHDQVVDLLLEKGAPITAKTKNGLAPLHMASQGDHVDSARILLYHKAPVDDVTVDYLTALHVAAHCGHVRVAKLLLDRKADPNSRALNGFTPLHIACKKNRIKVVELLLKHGASIEATTESGLTPLHVASFMGCMNIVIYLIQHGANPDVPTVRGETPLHLAARANQSDIIRILLRNGAHVDASAREQQTPLHIAARLGNVDIVGLLLQHGAAVDATTKDMYTALHIAAKEGQEEVASVLLDHGASLTATTKKGFTPLHLAAKYGNIKVARLLLQKEAPVDAQGKNGVTPLHVAAHYDHVNVALLLLDKGAFPHATAKNGYTPLHIAAKKNQMDIATTLLEYGAKPSAESKAGFTPLHLASQEGHSDMTTLLIEHHGDVNAPAKNGLTPLHLCAQEDKVNVAAILVKNGAKVDPATKAGYTPLHVACHFGQINMIRFLLQHGADVNSTTSHGYTPLHQAAQQGHTLIINLLLEHKASPNTTTNQGQTALSIAQRLGYISVVETLKVVTETIVTTTTTTITEEKYKVVAPETMQETFMSDSEDEGGDDIEDTTLYGKPAHATHVYLPYIEGQKLQSYMTDDTMLGADQSLHYMTTDELKALGDDNTLGIDVTRDERGTDSLIAPLTAEEDHLTPQHIAHQEATYSSMAADNVDLARAPVHAGKLKWKTFLVSFMVDARGGAMRGCRHSGVRVIIPPRRAPMPMRITCRYLRKEKLAYPPPLMEGEACASRILEVGPSGAKFLGPVIIEVPHFASLRGREREITILRSDNGESWREHSLEASDDAVHDVFNESFEGEELTAIEDLSTNRITRILTTDFPQYFAIITRIRQEVHAIGPEGGMVSSTVIPQVQAIFPEGALTKKIKVGLQAHPITPELVTKLLGNRVAVSPIVTVEPRRRKFHKPITLTIPVPQAATKGMINQYSGDAPTLRLLCSITGSTNTGGTTKAQWEDVTGSTPLTFVNDCVSFTTTVSARFWLFDCRQVNEATKFATELYREAIHVPFMAKFVVFAKRRDPLEAQLRVFCMTDDKEDKTLESQEHFTEVAKSRDVEVLEGKHQFLEFAGNLVPVTKSGEQLSFTFQAFRENRLPFTIRVKDTHQEPMGRVAFMREARVSRGEAPQSPICNLKLSSRVVSMVADLTPVSELVTLEKKYGFVTESSLAKPEQIHRADLRLSDIAKGLGSDWIALALQLDLSEAEINSIRSENPSDVSQQAHAMLKHWLKRSGSRANGNLLEKGLRKINREDIVNECMFNVELVTDDVERAVAKVHLDQSGFDTFKEELGPSRDASLRRDISLNGTYDEQDIMKDAESAAESSSESSDRDAHFRSEKRHSGSRKTETSSHSNKGNEDGMDTLVQHIPTAMAESFTQNVSNGQVSDNSAHEDDKSEPTAATLSSEATADNEVSSWDDKSHTEKREYKPSYGSNPQPVYKSARNANRNSKSVKEIKRNNKEMSKRKVSFSVNPWTMTVSVANKRRKKLVRRNTWPADSPRKLNMQKKYQQRLKSKTFPEPFWSNTYEWLVMQNSPEEVKCAPLAKSEFVDLVAVKNFTPVTPYAYKSPLEFYAKKENKPKMSKVSKPNSPDTLGFYFTVNVNKKVCNDPKKYLMKLKKRCLPDLNVQNLHVTDFENSLIEEKPLYNDEVYSFETYNQVTRQPLQSSNVALEDYLISENYLVGDSAAVEIENTVSRPFHVTYQQLNTPIRVPRPFHDSNMDSFGDVLTQSSMTFLDNDVISLKSKISVHNSGWNKENILKNKTSFPDTKLPKPVEKFKIPVSNTVPKKGYDIATPRKPFENKPITPSSRHTDHKIGIYKLPKDIETNNPNITRSPQDMPDQKSSGTNKSGSSKDNVSSSYSTASQYTSSGSTGSMGDTTGDIVSGEGSSSNLGQKTKPYARQLFEKDIQSNLSKAKDKDTKKDQLTKQQDASGSLQVDNTTTDTSGKQNPSSSAVPSDVVGFSFLKYLKDHIESEETAKEPTFPASVVGHAFLNALVEQQNKFQENVQQEKSIPASVLGLSFLKNLCEQGREIESREQFPASALGQAFLDTLAASQNQPTTSKDKSAHSGKSSIDDSKTKSEQSRASSTIPANVLGQTFLKNILEQSVSVQDTVKQSTVPKDTETSSNKTIPASVLGQSFIKSLVQETDDKRKQESEKSIPSSVVGQAFLKTLMEDQSKVQSIEEKHVPASVVGQAFLKTLLDQGTVKKDESIAKPVPSTVVSQAFLKSLMGVEQSAEEPSAESNKAIPSNVVGQAFLKTLLDQGTVKEDECMTKPVPSTVVSQAFLKSLMGVEQSGEELSEESDKAIPSTVVGQAFLKTLLDQGTIKEKESDSNPKPVPSNVIGQAFLKSLVGVEQPGEEPSEKDNKVIPSTVVGQAFLKTLFDQGTSKEVKGSTNPIPSSVVGQSFLKSLTEVEQSIAQSADSKAIPSTVISQSFLKMLVAKEEAKHPDSAESAQEVSQKVIPATALSQSFLKSLIDMREPSSAEESSDKPVPSSVVSQAFLKTLISEAPSEKQEEKSFPASVVGQAFLKILMSESDSITESSVPKRDQTSESSTEESVEKIIPSNVLGQSFLMSLIQQGSSSPEASRLESSKKSENPLPASVIGSAFLKALSSESCSKIVPPETSVSDKTKEPSPMQANVIGQAFLKTLLSMSSDTPSTESYEGLEEAIDNLVGTHTEALSFPKEELNGKSSGFDTFFSDPVCTQQQSHSNLPSASDEQNVIIPPPPEFSSAQPIASTSSDIDPTSEIIGELLSYTKMMHSVIESLKDSSSSEADSSKK
ncbi:hypothetical protein JTE90_025919 [Oedothorax gibbosus]|uniref:Ankyrin-3 n=1 Tax=Oedothorax gibbosus TaxID=931172 RepID=A0AAV6UVP5_9ARAC|nr:hypothetical protein JTE90_025919 [Oedothorax gibbosus]